jgi:molybdopterin adenylyltransferase
MEIKVAILTVSDECSEGRRADVSGQTIQETLPAALFEVCEKTIVPNDYRAVAAALRNFSDRHTIDVVLTTGGTGLGPRDATPEATTNTCDRMVPGLSEILRSESFKRTPNAVLSRGVSGLRDNTLIINLPGSPEAVRACLETILDVLPRAIDMMRGDGR